MVEDEGKAVPDGAAVFPLIPEELGVDPLLLAAIHASVFLDGSTDQLVDPAAAEEALHYLAGYLQRLDGPRLQRVREDIECLASYARRQKWPRAEIRYLQEFLSRLGVARKGRA